VDALELGDTPGTDRLQGGRVRNGHRRSPSSVWADIQQCEWSCNSRNVRFE
jgi:hypothetical protein